MKNRWREAILPNSTLTKNEQSIIADLLCQEDRKYDDQHDQQLMTHEHNTRQGHHNPSNPPSNILVDSKLIMCKNESFSTEAMNNEDITAIMDELTTVEQQWNDSGTTVEQQWNGRLTY